MLLATLADARKGLRQAPSVFYGVGVQEAGL